MDELFIILVEFVLEFITITLHSYISDNHHVFIISSDALKINTTSNIIYLLMWCVVISDTIKII
jgi:hypothetical protein